MEIRLNAVSKSYGRGNVLNRLDLNISSGEKLAVLGTNGSGKSTLLMLLSSQLLPDSGEVRYSHTGSEVKAEDAYKYISIVTPSMELPGEITTAAVASLYFSLRPISHGLTMTDFPRVCLDKAHHQKKISELSTGMRQRIRLGLAVMTEAPLLLLDEPLSNLDQAGQQWFAEIISRYAADKTIVVASNHNTQEYGFCNRTLVLSAHNSC